MSTSYYKYDKLSSLLGDKETTKPLFNKNLKIKDDEKQISKIKLMSEKMPSDNKNNVPKDNNNSKKANGIEIDTPNPDKMNNISNNNNYNEYINEILSQKETKLLTNSQYVSFINNIGDNSCYVNVVMHFLYIFPCVNDFLIKKYNEKKKEKEKEEKKEKEKEEKKEKEKEEKKEKEEEKDQKQEKEGTNGQKKDESEKIEKENKTSNTNNQIKIKNPENGKVKKKSKEEEYNDFIFNLGKTLNSYQEILATTNSKKNITNLNTLELRKSLSICSDNQFKLNNICDPVEFLIYILELINKENSEEIHLYFHLKLIEEVRCSNFCPFKSNKKYDKDNFIYQIYVEEIFNYIKNQKLNFDDFRENLFMLSYYSLQNEMNFCEKCKSIKNRILICNNENGSPKFLLVNCVWNNAKPELTDVIKFLYFISLIEELENLFICPSKTEKTNYYLNGIIFYSYTLCHYINVIFNLEKNVFTLYNDDGIIEFDNMNEIYNYITKDQLKKNNKAFFYPVLLVYGKENIYDEKVLLKLKRTNKINYELLLDECDKLIKLNKPKERKLTDEEKKKNYQELLLAQIKYDRENMEKNSFKENDDIYSFMRNKDSDRLKKLNIINDQPKKIKLGNNNFLNTSKDIKKTNKGISVDNRYSGKYGAETKLYNPYSNNYINKNNIRPQKKVGNNNYEYNYHQHYYY